MITKGRLGIFRAGNAFIDQQQKLRAALSDNANQTRRFRSLIWPR